jgi:hypothetical protein
MSAEGVLQAGRGREEERVELNIPVELTLPSTLTAESEQLLSPAVSARTSFAWRVIADMT